MTKEEIIHRLQYAKHRIDNVTYAPDVLKAIDIAIEAVSNTDADTISRQGAIELVKDVCDAIMSGCESWYDPETEDEVYTDIREVDAILKCNKEVRIALRNMSSAQPERIIHCKDCEWWTKQECSPQGRCALSGMYPTGGWFCGNARRREVTE